MSISTMSTFEPGKEYKTRDGRRARVYAVDVNDENDIHGAILIRDKWRLAIWTQNGRHWNFDEESGDDLMPPKRGWWVNVYQRGGRRPTFIDSGDCRQEADDAAAPDRIACVYIEEGDGL